MLGFSELLKSNFGESATPLTLPLEPRLKSGQNDATAAPPEFFETLVGERRVPRDKDPKKPNYEMIKDARKGILSGFLRSGKIFRASDFVGYANPKTAIITLGDIYDFETRCLAALDDQPISRPPLSSIVPFGKAADKGADDEKKTLRNLFFIALAHDELPSFHFWTKPGDLDPVTAGQPIDWGKHFDENPPSPTTKAKIAMLENERKEKVQRGAGEQHNTQNKQALGFLDRYNDINLPGLGREPTQRQPTDDIDSGSQTSAAPVFAQSPLEAEVLLQFNRGGMYLREFTHRALYAMACWLVGNEEEDEEEKAKEGPTEIWGMFLDILGPGKVIREEKIVSVSRASNRNFQDNIKPVFGRPDNKFRIRSTRYQSSWNLESGFDSGGVGELKYDLKIVRPNVGYCYCSANWHNTGDLYLNNLHFEKALRFLFDWDSSAYPKSNNLSLDIPGHGAFGLDRNSNVVVDDNIQKIFAELSGTPVKSDSHPVEIFIRDVFEDVTDGSDSLSTSSPRHGNAKSETGPGEVPDVLQAPSGAGPYVDQGSINALGIPDQPPSDILGGLITGQLPEPSSIKATEGRGGPDFLSIHPRLLTNAEINELKDRLKIAEASVVETDGLQERLRIAEEKLSEMNSLEQRLRTSESRAKLKSSCPFCPQDWAGVTKQQQQDHLKLHQKKIVRQPDPQKCPQPNCTSWLGENQTESSYETISEHLRLHIEEEHAEDGICQHKHCHTNMYAQTAKQQEEHESVHRDNEETEEERDRLQEEVKNLERIVKERDQLQEQVRDLRDTATERDQLQQQVRHLQDAANEWDRLQEDLVSITAERDSLRDRAMELERRSKAGSGLDEGMQTKEPVTEAQVDEDPKQPSQSEAPKKLRYCNVCLKSVDKMSVNAKTKHADKCETSVSEFLLLNPVEAKSIREKRNNSRDVVRPQAPEGPKEETEMPNTGEKSKQKASATAAPLESGQDEAEDANAAQEPEASKATGRKKPKRKFDTFKPPKEDESNSEDLESPKKKPKLKAKAPKAEKRETAPTRRSARGKDIYEPPEEEEDVEEAYDEPSSSAKGSKRTKRMAPKKTRTNK